MHKLVRHMRLDRRLVRRRGWIEPDELERELALLPDAADKSVPLTSEDESQGPEAAPGEGASGAGGPQPAAVEGGLPSDPESATPEPATEQKG